MSNVVLCIHRMAHLLYIFKIPVLPKFIAYINRIIFSCYIGPGARIGKKVILGYGGLGTVIHPDAEIGDNVHIGSGVTIGGRSKLKRVPVIGKNSVIGSGAKILGPITLGENSVVGANAVVIDDVPPRTLVAGIPAIIKKREIDISDYHNGIAKS